MVTTGQVLRDITFPSCFECGKEWVMPGNEHAWWLSKIKVSADMKMPTRCSDCRKRNKTSVCFSSSGRPKSNFKSQADAEFTEKTNREDGLPQQYIYKCLNCEFFHLTSKVPINRVEVGAPQLAQVRYDEPLLKMGRGAHGDTQEKVRLLSAAGLPVTEISKKLNITPTSVYYHLRTIRETDTPTVNKTDATLSGFVLKKRRMQEEMDRITEAERHYKEEVERTKRDELLSIIANGGDFMVRKRSQRMTFTAESFRELIEQARKIENLRIILAE
jgi:hypothetical protein